MNILLVVSAQILHSIKFTKFEYVIVGFDVVEHLPAFHSNIRMLKFNIRLCTSWKPFLLRWVWSTLKII